MEELSFIMNNNNYYGDNDSVRSVITMCLGIVKDAKQSPIFMENVKNLTKLVCNAFIELLFYTY